MKWRLKTYLKNLKGVGDWQRSPFFFSFFIWSHGGGIRRLKQLYERERESSRNLPRCSDNWQCYLWKLKRGKEGSKKRLPKEAIRLNIRLMINYDDKNYIASGGRTRGKKKLFINFFISILKKSSIICTMSYINIKN